MSSCGPKLWVSCDDQAHLFPKDQQTAQVEQVLTAGVTPVAWEGESEKLFYRLSRIMGRLWKFTIGKLITGCCKVYD